MTGFKFPPPPPPPPKAPPVFSESDPSRRGASSDRHRGRGRGRGGFSSGPVPRGQSHPSAHAPARVYNPLSGANATPNGPTSSESYPPRTAAGHKRKLDALRGPPPAIKACHPVPPTAPAVPSFGGPLHPPTPNPPPRRPPGKSLGLVPRPDDARDSSSEPDADANGDGDEEKLYAELGNQLTFEYNDAVQSLTSAAELAAWKQARRSRWPSRGRVAQREEELKAVGRERRRLLGSAWRWVAGEAKAAGGAPDGPVRTGNGQAPAAEETQPQTPDDESPAQRPCLEALRQRVAASEAKNRRARAAAASEPTPASPAEPAPSPSSSSSPERHPSTKPIPPRPSDGTRVDPGPSAAKPEMPARPAASTKPARPKHESSAARGMETGLGRKGIAQRLREKQEEEADWLAVRAIRALGRAGAFGEGGAGVGEGR